ncbi:hypothetical protein [Marinomonas atlantica]|uniref:hypothetical protein n=1 Tax=Marinomonas atlantica TaxID=1806668 RepID=UPI000836CD23|nr:hypothetical protein [Marinomonas atlantica]MCO4784963.1 hypothetical protein [Marinomonas atlantica]
MPIVSYTGTKAKKQRGLAAIELALGFVGFWTLCLVWVEMSYVSYMSALGDIMITQASSEAKRGDSGFLTAFDNALAEQDSLWRHLVDEDDFTTSIRYVADFEALAAISGDAAIPIGESGDVDSPIAIYRISYRFTPVFTTLFGSTEEIFTREMIVIQESKLQ